MKLLEIEIPSFKALENVHLSFERNFKPSIFPIGSLNGGGKSTLLQLTFVLLSFINSKDKHEYIKNILNGFTVSENEQKTLAKYKILYNEKEVELEFLVCHNNYAKEYIKDSSNEYSFSVINEYGYLLSERENFESKLQELEKDKLELSKVLQENKSSNYIEKTYYNILKKYDIDTNIKSNSTFKINSFIEKNILEKNELNLSKHYTNINIDKLNKLSESFLMSIDTLDSIISSTSVTCNEILNNLKNHNTFYITSFSSNSNNEKEDSVLLLKTNLEETDKDNFFYELSNSLFLASPETQVFQFLSKSDKKVLFKANNYIENLYRITDNYYHIMHKTKKEIKNLFTYDYLSVDIITNLFIEARNKDFKEKLEKGIYGNNFEKITKELSNLFNKINITTNETLEEVIFKVEDKNIALEPEDLSHGELRRLGIYSWLKSIKSREAIILMDEIEIALHPDWQFQIIQDLQNWASNHQFILATHSYELCSALTPSHVKELEPRLIKN